MPTRLCLVLPFALFLIAASAQAEHPAAPTNPIEWMLRTNGWHWGDGYHAYNNCHKSGVLPRSYVPMHAGYPAQTWNAPSSYAAASGPNYPPSAFYQAGSVPARSMPAPRQMAPAPQVPTNAGFPTGPSFNAPQQNDRAAFRPGMVRP